MVFEGPIRMARTRWLFTLLYCEIFNCIGANNWAFLFTQVYVVKLVFFNFVGVFDYLKAFLGQQPKSTCDKVNCVVRIVTVSCEISWWRVSLCTNNEPATSQNFVSRRLWAWTLLFSRFFQPGNIRSII